MELWSTKLRSHTAITRNIYQKTKKGEKLHIWFKSNRKKNMILNDTCFTMLPCHIFFHGFFFMRNYSLRIFFNSFFSQDGVTPIALSPPPPSLSVLPVFLSSLFLSCYDLPRLLGYRVSFMFS